MSEIRTRTKNSGDSLSFVIGLPVVTEPVRLDDLPGLLAPYALTAPIFVYLMASGHLLACRMRRHDAELTEDDLILVLMPRRRRAAVS